MNTRVLALLLLAAVFLAGCPQPPPVPIDKEPPSLEQQTSTFDPLARCRSLSYSKQQECITEVAVQGAYPSLCDELDAKNRTKCLRDTAIQARNPEFCRGIQQIATRNVCYKTIALLTRKFEPCASLTTGTAADLFSKNDCYDDVADKTADASACAYLTEEVINQAGFQYHRDQCYWGVFVQTKDAGICSKFLDPAKALACAEQSKTASENA